MISRDESALIMSTSLGEVFSALCPYIPGDAVFPQFKREIERIDGIVDGCFSSYYLEWHLDGRRECDLLCSLMSENSGRLHRRLTETQLAEKDERWSALCRFLASWGAINERLDNLIPHLWLAFDFNRAENFFEPPNIHFCIDRRFIERTRMPEYTNPMTVRQFNLALKEIILCGGFQISDPAEDLLCDYFRRLDKIGGEVLHISFMHARIPPVFKLNCTIASEEIISILSDLQWSGDSESIATLCREFAPREQRIKFNICIDGKEFNRFEIELEYNTPLESDPRREFLLEAMRRRGLITQGRMRDLLKWPGRSVCDTPAADGRHTAYLERWLDIKICIDRPGSIVSKAYLGFAPTALQVRW